MNVGALHPIPSRRVVPPGADAWQPADGVDDVSSREERYSLRHVEQSTGLSRAVIDGLVEAGCVTPQRGPGNQRRFSFQDLMLLRTAHDLRQAKVTPKRIVEALGTLRAALPAGAALTGMRVSAMGSRVIVRDREGAREAASGQFVIDFDAPPRPTAEPTTSLPSRPQATVLELARADARRMPSGLRSIDSRKAANDEFEATPAPTSSTSTAYERAVALEATDPAAAEAEYRRALEQDPGHLQAAINLAAMLCDQGRASQADIVCMAMLSRGVDDALLRFNHALALDDLKRPRAALAAYQRAIDLDPTFADAHYNAACLLESMRDAQGALRHFAAYRKLQGI